MTNETATVPATRESRMPRPVELPDSLDACSKLMEELSSSSISLETALSEAKAKAYSDGLYADRKWFRRASAKLRYVKRHRQMLQEHMAALRRKDKAQITAQNATSHEINRQYNVLRQEAARVYDRILLDVIKENTSRELFMEWVGQAQKRMSENVTLIDE